MDWIEISTLVFAIAVNLLILGFVYVRKPTSATHRLLALQIIILSLWSATNFFAVNAQTEFSATWLVRAVMFFAVPNSVVFFLFVHTFPRASLAMSKKQLWGWIAITLITMAASISPLVFPEVELHPGSPPSPKPGVGMILFGPVAIGTILLGIFYLIKKFRNARGIEKTQLQFLLVGVAIMFIAIISLNFVSVIVFNTSAFNKFGSLFTLPFTILAAYTMLRHRLMDIRLAIFRALSLTFLIGSVLIIYGILVVFAVPAIARAINFSTEVVAAGAALFSIPLAQYIQRILTRLTDKFLFQNRADYSAELVNLGQKLSRTIKIEEVSETILGAMRTVLRSQKTVIFLRESESGEFLPSAMEGVKGMQVTIPQNHALVDHLSHADGPLSKDEIALQIEQEVRPQHRDELANVLTAFEWLDVSVAVPLFVDKGLTGIILLGQKLSGEPYLSDDIDFLNAFAPQAATALENARLYKESLEFAQRLEEEVERATHELAIANEQLRDLDKAKSEFLSIASHQLYTPLTALRGYISMLQEGDYGKVDEKQQEVLDILEKSATRLIDLIKNLLDISRIESGRLELNLEQVDIAEMAKELVQDLMPNAMNKNLDLQFHEAEQELAKVIVDRERVRQVMLNFIDNSIKYTDQGKIDVFVTQENQEIVFSVQDTGKGISEEEIRRLFNKFTRVGGAARFHTEGSGLGLYVAKQIVKEHHGDVHVESPGKGEGSTFAMRLPIEGAPNSLKLGDKATVVIKAAEAQGVEKDNAADK